MDLVKFYEYGCHREEQGEVFVYFNTTEKGSDVCWEPFRNVIKRKTEVGVKWRS